MLKFVQKGSKDWPLYTLILAFGQLLGFSSIQLILLDSREQQLSTNTFATGSVFILGTLVWWALYRSFPSRHVLYIPFIIYSAAFVLFFTSSLSVVSLHVSWWADRFALWLYTFASSSGCFYFTLNFGEECGSSSQKAIFRASVVEGIRQLWIAGIWLWSKPVPANRDHLGLLIGSGLLAALCGLSAFLLFFGLPECYRTMSPSIPNYWKAMIGRNLVLWFWLSEGLATFWLSGLYGQTWAFLWNQPLPIYATILMTVFFFVFVWGILLRLFMHFSQKHSWIICVFAIGLISPRWAQIFWATSTLGTSLAWASNFGAILSLALFLWLGVLAAIQQVGLSMMLLQTLTRIHVAGCLMVIQVLGAFGFMMSRLVWIKTNDVFPNIGLWDLTGDLFTPWIYFWVLLVLQVFCAYGYLFWFRKEQLARP